MQQDNFCKTCCSRTVTPRAVIGCGLAELASDWLTLGWRETAVEVGGGAALGGHSTVRTRSDRTLASSSSDTSSRAEQLQLYCRPAAVLGACSWRQCRIWRSVQSATDR